MSKLDDHELHRRLIVDGKPYYISAPLKSFSCHENPITAANEYLDALALEIEAGRPVLGMTVRYQDGPERLITGIRRKGKSPIDGQLIDRAEPVIFLSEGPSPVLWSECSYV